jgi:hypothetical protein
MPFALSSPSKWHGEVDLFGSSRCERFSNHTIGAVGPQNFYLEGAVLFFWASEGPRGP